LTQVKVEGAKVYLIRGNGLKFLMSCAALGIVADGPAQSQGMGDAPMHTMHQPYNIETFGLFRNMLLTGDFTPKVQLGAAIAKHPTTGVGARLFWVTVHRDANHAAPPMLPEYHGRFLQPGQVIQDLIKASSPNRL
jgi:hypothetical protein